MLLLEADKQIASAAKFVVLKPTNSTHRIITSSQHCDYCVLLEIRELLCSKVYFSLPQLVDSCY